MSDITTPDEYKKALECFDWYYNYSDDYSVWSSGQRRLGELTAAQQRYAAADVIHLHAIKERLDTMLLREGRAALAGSVFQCLPTRAELDLLGWSETDFFAH